MLHKNLVKVCLSVVQRARLTNLSDQGLFQVASWRSCLHRKPALVRIRGKGQHMFGSGTEEGAWRGEVSVDLRNEVTFLGTAAWPQLDPQRIPPEEKVCPSVTRASDEAPSVHVSSPSRADVTDNLFQVWELPPGHVPQILHVWRRETEAVAVEMPLTCASLREEECFVLDAKTCVYIWCGLRSSRSDNTVCTSLAQSRQETGKLTFVKQRARLTTSSETCLAVRHRSKGALFQERYHHDSLPQSPRMTLTDPSIQPQKSRRQVRNVLPRSRKPTP